MAEANIPLPLSPQNIGDSFVQQYYGILHRSPELLHQFYQDTSTLSRPETNGVSSLTTTMQAIKEKILSFNAGNFKLEIKSVDAQASFYDGVHVLVTGNLIWEDNTKQYFSQSFFLAPQEKGFFVLNDIFRVTGDTIENINGPAKIVESPPTPEHNHSPAHETLDSKETTEIKEVLWEEEIKPSEVEQVSAAQEEVFPMPEVVNEVPENSSLVDIPISKIVDGPKKTYASIVMMMKDNVKTLSSPAPVPRKPALKSQAKDNVKMFSSPAPVPQKSAMKSQEHINPAQVLVASTETAVPGLDSTENANIPESEADGCSIYIKGLPMDVTISQLEEECKKFGAIKNGGIQVKSSRGFCFGFVQFEVASSVQQAIKASPIVIGGRQARIEEKKSTISRGTNRDRSSNGRGHGGFRNDGTRGRGYYVSGRGLYSRNNSNGRSEFGNKSGYSGGGDRPDEDGLVSIKGPATSSAPRVTVIA